MMMSMLVVGGRVNAAVHFMCHYILNCIGSRRYVFVQEAIKDFEFEFDDDGDVAAAAAVSSLSASLWIS